MILDDKGIPWGGSGEAVCLWGWDRSCGYEVAGIAISLSSIYYLPKLKLSSSAFYAWSQPEGGLLDLQAINLCLEPAAPVTPTPAPNMSDSQCWPC